MNVKIGLIGTGMLGEAVGLHLLKSGYSITAYNRTKSKTQNLKENGATIVDTPKQVAKNSDLVITCVKDSNALNQVSFDTNGIIHGSHNGLVVADMSTINPNHIKEIAKKFHNHNITMLDIPVMGGPNVAIKGELIMMISGDHTTFEKFKNVFEIISQKTFYLGDDNGTAHTIKLAMNLQIAMLAISISEGITFTKSAHMDPKIFLDILNSTYFATGMSKNKAYKMIQDDFRPTFLLKNLKKDLHTINESAESLGINLPMGTMAQRIYQMAVEAGFGDLDYTGILSYMKYATDTKYTTHDSKNDI